MFLRTGWLTLTEDGGGGAAWGGWRTQPVTIRKASTSAPNTRRFRLQSISKTPWGQGSMRRERPYGECYAFAGLICRVTLSRRIEGSEKSVESVTARCANNRVSSP